MKGQDFHLSMYDAAPMFLNPALTGVVDSKFRVHAQYRNQWRSVAFKPYTTAVISLDAPKGKWGFGGQIINMRAGIGNYNALQGLFSVSYAVAIDARKYNNISFGFQTGINQKSIEVGLYTFNNQYVSANGGSFDNTIASGETFNRQVFFTPQLNTGFIYFYSKQQSRLNPFFGYSAFNLLYPKETFYNTNNKLPVRHYFHGGLRVNFSEFFYVIPKALLMLQKDATEQIYSIDAGYYLKNDDFYLLGGYSYRHKDASVFYIGGRKNNYIAKISYDANTSSLKGVSKYRGAFELSFTYLAKPPKSKTLKHCPRL